MLSYSIDAVLTLSYHGLTETHVRYWAHCVAMRTAVRTWYLRQRIHEATITSLWRQNDIAVSFWRHDNVNIVLGCALGSATRFNYDFSFEFKFDGKRIMLQPIPWLYCCMVYVNQSRRIVGQQEIATKIKFRGKKCLVKRTTYKYPLNHIMMTISGLRILNLVEKFVKKKTNARFVLVKPKGTVYVDWRSSIL